jgi:dTDP-4-dehydrorhamnose 3,5-epimerase
MRIEPSGLEGLCLLRWDVAADERGRFARMFCRDEMSRAGLPFAVAQENLSHSLARHTLRGLHYQHAPHGEAKIVSCLAGRLWDVAVDLRPGSATFRQWRGFELSPASGASLFVPEGFAHGLLTLEPDTQVHYLVSAPYAPEAGAGVRWDDPAIGIEWPAPPALMSERDRAWPLLGT